MYGSSPSKKRKADEQFETTSIGNTRNDLINLRSAVATAEPAALQKYIMSKFDSAIDSLTPMPSPHEPFMPPGSSISSAIVSTSLAAASASPMTSASTSAPPQHHRTDTGFAVPLTSPAISAFLNTTPSSVNALSTIFSDIVNARLPPATYPPPPAISSEEKPSTSLSPSYPPEASQSLMYEYVTHQVAVPFTTPSSDLDTGIIGTSSTMENLHQAMDRGEEHEEEQHCARCHTDFLPSTNRFPVCLIEHNHENCVRIAKNGQVSSVWEYQCCGYRFESPYADEPEDENADGDRGMYCFVGRHTTDEEEAAARKMNTYSCDELGCWEVGSGSG